MVSQGIRAPCPLSGSSDGEDDSLKGGCSVAFTPGLRHDDCDVAPNLVQIYRSKSVEARSLDVFKAHVPTVESDVASTIGEVWAKLKVC